MQLWADGGESAAQGLRLGGCSGCWTGELLEGEVGGGDSPPPCPVLWTTQVQRLPSFHNLT